MSFHESDAFFARGKTHMVCEDFAVAGRAESGAPYAIVSDGCSSSENTDTGARLLTHTAASYMNFVSGGEESFEQYQQQMIEEAADAVCKIDLDLQCLDATLLAAYWKWDENGKPGVGVSLRGDGVIVARLRNGEGYGLYVIDHVNNAPRYLSYDLEPHRLEGYLKKYSEKYTMELCGVAVQVGMDMDTWDPETGKGDLKKGWLEPIKFEGHMKDMFFPAAHYDLVMLLSDGVLTFQRPVTSLTSKSYEDVPVEEVVEQLLTIKTTSASFLKRRCHRFLTRFCVKHGWQHTDDFSAGAIWMGKPKA